VMASESLPFMDLPTEGAPVCAKSREHKIGFIGSAHN
jgi:hypothetical protein